MSKNIEASRSKGGLATLAWVCCAVLAAVYVVSWIVRLAGGPATMEASSTVPWGGMMGVFFFLATVGGGLLALGALVSWGLLPAVEKFLKPIYIGAVACLCAAGTVVLIDLGRPERVMNMILFLRFGSPFAWDFIFLAASIVLGAVCIFRRPGFGLGTATGLCGLAVVAVEGVIFLVSPGRGLWDSVSVPVLFIVEAVVCGLAVAALMAPTKEDRTARPLAAALILVAVFMVAEWGSAAMAGTEEALDMVLLMSGPLAPLYWIQLVGCVAVPAVLLLAVQNQTVVRVSAVLALVGVLLAKLTILLAGQMIDVTGVVVVYAPSLLEVAISCGSAGFAGLLYLVGAKLFSTSYAPARQTDAAADVDLELEAGRL